MTIPLENLADGSLSDRNFQKLARFVLDTGGITAGFRFGTATVHFSGAQFSNTVTVTHGLGLTPVAYGAFGNSGGGIHFGCSNPTDETFDVRADYWPSAITQDAVCSWVVIG